MNAIKQIKTTIITIFQVDDIDIHSLKRDSAIQKIQDNFQLKKLQLPGQIAIPLNQIILQHGEYKYNAKSYTLDQIIIEERKITINILSNSEIADCFFEDLVKILKSIDTREHVGTYEPLIKTYETACVLKLNFSLDKAIKNINHRELNKVISENNSHGATITLIPSALKFQIQYSDIPEKLEKNKISISDKAFFIELREMTDPYDKIYYTTSPTDTRTHLTLLKTLEEMIK